METGWDGGPSQVKRRCPLCVVSGWFDRKLQSVQGATESTREGAESLPPAHLGTGSRVPSLGMVAAGWGGSRAQHTTLFL